MPFNRGLTLLGVVVLLAGCADVGEVRPTPPEQPTESAPIPNPAVPTPAPAPIDLPCMQTSHGCIALNPDVTAESLAQTICVVGYTATIRPSMTYTNGVKAKLLEKAGQDRSQMGAYELDHVIPLAVGGHPRKLSNLALQPWYGENSATEKDGLERRLQHMVCNGEISLTDAQFCIAEDWHACQAEIAAGHVISGGEVVTESAPSTAPVEPP